MRTEEFRLFLLLEQKGKKRLRGTRTITLHLELLTRLHKNCPTLSPLDVSSYLLAEYEKGRKGTYLNDYIDTLHVYGRFLKSDLYKELKYFPEEKFEKATMSDEEIEKFLQLPCTIITRYDHRVKGNVTYPIGKNRWVKMSMFWKCLAYSGCRPGEIAGLSVNDVDFGRGVFSVNGKTGHRIVPIAPVLTAELTAYVKDLTGEYLFPSTQGGISKRQGKPILDDTDWGYDFHQRIKRLGIKRKNLTPYSLRHSFITRLLNEDINLYKVQNLVGHTQGSPITSQYYHLTTKALIKTISQDTLGRHQLTYDERFMQFRNIVRLALENFAKDVSEERKMLEDLVKTFL